MSVKHAGDIRPGFVNGAVNDIAGKVDAVIGIGLGNDVALDVDFDEARCRDFLVEKAVKIDQQMLGAGNARRDMVVDKVGHAVGIDQPIASGEIDPSLPFLCGDFVAH